MINCIIVDDESVAREILENHLGRIGSIKVGASCKNAIEAFRAINEQQIDLVFLDINMPGIDGLSFVKSMTRDIKVIFTTAYREYAVDGFDLRAVDYLLKPISFERLLQAINRFVDESGTQRNDRVERLGTEAGESFYVKSDRKMVRIWLEGIRYIESFGDYLKFHLEDRTVVTRETMTVIEAKLPADQFIRTHRSFLVSVSSIDSFTSEVVEVGNHEIPVSRGYRDQVISRLEQV